MNKSYGVIYKMTNVVTNKSYIGQTTYANPEKRIKSHFVKRRGVDLVYNSSLNHGKSTFIWELLYTSFSFDDLNEKEIYFIDEFKTLVPLGYNVKLGGRGGGLCTPETKIKISQNIKNWYKTHISIHLGKKKTKEHCASLSKVRKGFTNENRRLASVKSRLKLSKSILAINISTKDEFIFNSIMECSRVLSLNSSNISRVLNKKQNRTQHKGFTFKYIKEDV